MKVIRPHRGNDKMECYKKSINETGESGGGKPQRAGRGKTSKIRAKIYKADLRSSYLCKI